MQIVGSYRRLDELSDKLEKFSYRVLKEDCLDLPEKVFTKELLSCLTNKRKVYDK